MRKKIATVLLKSLSPKGFKVFYSAQVAVLFLLHISRKDDVGMLKGILFFPIYVSVLMALNPASYNVVLRELHRIGSKNAVPMMLRYP